MTSTPSCSVVIVTYNRCATLARTLVRLHALPEEPEIVVVDNGSRDDTVNVVARTFPYVRIVALTYNAGAAGRNAGVAEARAPYIAFCDDDCWWEPGSLARASAELAIHPQVGLLNGRVIVDGSHLDPACTLMASSTVPKRSACPGRSIVQFMAGAAIVRRSAFLSAGGYHPRYHLGAEESLLAIDLLERGWELVYHPALVLHHAPHRGDRRPYLRRVAVIRNRLWTAWLRHSFAGVRSATLATARAALSDRASRRAFAEALRGLPWVVRERRPVKSDVERLLDHVVELAP